MPPLPNLSSVANGMTPPPGTFSQGPAPSGTDSLAPLFQALAQAMAQQARTGQGRLSLQGAQTFGRHLGTGGAEVTPQNPTGNPSNPWDAEGLFHGGFGAQLSPEGRMATQGNSAISQMAGQGLVPGVDPGKLAQAQSGFTPTPGSGPTPKLDQFSDPFFIRRQQQNPYSTMFQQPQQPQQQLPTQPGSRKGSSFNFMGDGSPRPGFGFGAGM